ncbi:stage III sporulation protein AG [Caldanaerobius fijiensis DSM 17918]|uniref:Stage III sporulation protein AG n=1 Tax=Caldanaerobius fijiensis DSM 17918 TaxID=1121256 RepID=A0A1M4U6U2_9THEO|nr:hypothetical protein [Caldanaerobius fijiensis]SHE52459.1 stage III sporulation protein AG [Caldanaerobius fijiensis DSM 17918]
MKSLLKFINFKYDKKMENLIVLTLMGIILIIAGSFFVKGADSNKTTDNIKHIKATDIDTSYESALEKKLKDILSKVDGVRGVDVMVTLASDKSTLIPAVDNNESRRVTEEKDNQGGTRTITEYSNNKKTVTISTASGTQPLVLSETVPDVKGVLVVVDGNNDSDFLYKLSNMVQVALGIPAYKVMVVAGK